MFNADFYNLIQSLWGTLGQAMRVARSHGDPSPPSPPALLLLRGGYAESPGWFMVQAAEFEPEPLTVAKLRVRDVYGAERLVRALLDLMVSEQWLDVVGEEYSLTTAGRKVMETLKGRAAVLARAKLPLDQKEVTRLADLLGRVIAASMACEEPPGNWCLAHSRNRAPIAGASPAEQIFQYVADFNAFRDDAHMAAWQPYHMAGCGWEAFALLCGGKGKTAVSIHNQLAYRGHTRGEYAAELEQLHARGWLEQERPGSYFVTPAGQAVWEDVERLTDAYFYEPWKTLSQKEILEAKNLMERLRDG